MNQRKVLKNMYEVTDKHYTIKLYRVYLIMKIVSPKYKGQIQVQSCKYLR